MAEKKNVSGQTNDEKLLKPKYDVVFQSLFSNKNKKETGYLISAILGTKVKIIKVSTELSAMRELPEEKVGRLDLVAETDNGEIIHIELQLVDYKNTVKRLIYDLSQNMAKQLIRGDDYSKVKRTVTIGLLNYNLAEIESKQSMHSIYQWREKNRKELLTSIQELHIIEMSKAKRDYKKNPNDKIAQWALFILNPNKKEVQSIMKENDEIKETGKKLETISKDDKIRKQAELLERWEREEKWNKQSLIDYGKEQGVEQGIEQNQKEIILNMLSKNLSPEQISEFTGIDIEKIKSIISEINKK